MPNLAHYIERSLAIPNIAGHNETAVNDFLLPPTAT
jgi:hypothetical protein